MTDPVVYLTPSIDLPPTFEDVFDGLAFEALSILYDRQRKYGSENIRQQGLWGIFTRIKDDKINRIQRAFNGRIEKGTINLDEIADADDETWEDGVFDLVNYGLIMLAVKRGVWGYPLREETGEVQALADQYDGTPPQLTLTPEEEAWIARTAFADGDDPINEFLAPIAGGDSDEYDLEPIDYSGNDKPDPRAAIERLEAERKARGLSGKEG